MGHFLSAIKPQIFLTAFSPPPSFSSRAAVLQGSCLWLKGVQICRNPSRDQSGGALLPAVKLQWGNTSLGSHPGTGVSLQKPGMVCQFRSGVIRCFPLQQGFYGGCWVFQDGERKIEDFLSKSWREKSKTFEKSRQAFWPVCFPACLRLFAAALLLA